MGQAVQPSGGQERTVEVVCPLAHGAIAGSDDGNTASGHAAAKVVAAKPMLVTANHVTQPAPKSAAKPTAGEKPNQEPEPEIKCGKCNNRITAGVDASGKAYTAARVADISTKSYTKPMCYNCFIETRNNGNGHGKDVAEAFSAAVVREEANHK